MRLHPFAVLALSVIAAHIVRAGAIAYDFPADLPVSGIYQATVDGKPVPVLETRVGHVLSFGMDGPVKIEVTLKKAPGKVVVRPLSAGLRADLAGGGCGFTLDAPRNLSVEMDGDLDHPLFVFANGPEKDRPAKNAPKVRYFEAGKTHEAGEIVLHDGEMLYMEGGAVVHGTIRALDGSNISIRGPGILDCRPRKKKTNTLVVRNCSRVTLSDFLLIDSHGWSIHLSGSDGVRMSNVRVLGWRANCDGTDIEYSKNVSIDGCFWRNSDDCIAVKALFPPRVKGISLEHMTDPEVLNGTKAPRIAGDEIGDISVTRSVFWNDFPGNAFEIGFELRADKLKGVTLKDCDIIHVRRGAAISIHNADRAAIEDVLIENVRVEDTDELLDFYVGLSIYSDDCPAPYRRNNPKRAGIPKENQDPAAHDNKGQWFVPSQMDHDKFSANRGSISNVRIRGLHCLTEPRSGSIFSGYDSKHGISKVTISDLVISGRPVKSAADAKLKLKDVQGLSFDGSASAGR